MPPIQTKHGDMVDWDFSEADTDFGGYEFFKDPPPRKSEPPQSTPSVQSDYVPPQNVVEDNERFINALKYAPNVVYSRFKQYGQLGVLGWCYEFSELIDNLKQLGFGGNMFLATRDQALATCEEILRLKLDVRMQLVIIYLSSQVARLRQFLDGERTFDDYPQADFPMEQRMYTTWT